MLFMCMHTMWECFWSFGMSDSEKKKEEELEVVEQEVDVEEVLAEAEQQLVLAREVLPEQVALIPINNRPLFPRMTVPLVIDDERLIKMLMEKDLEKDRHIGLVLRMPAANGDETRVAAIEEPGGIHRVGVIAEILQMGKVEGVDALHIVIAALERVRIASLAQQEPFMVDHIEVMLEGDLTDNPELKAYSVAIIKSIKELVQLNPLYKEELGLFMSHSNLQAHPDDIDRRGAPGCAGNGSYPCPFAEGAGSAEEGDRDLRPTGADQQRYREEDFKESA